jgi:hypothetical protein
VFICEKYFYNDNGNVTEVVALDKVAVPEAGDQGTVL